MPNGIQYSATNIMPMLSRSLPAILAGTKAFVNTAPTTEEQAMGQVGMDGIIGIGVNGTAAFADATLTLWIWNVALGMWMYGGCNSTDYAKVWVNKGSGSFLAPVGSRFYIQSSIAVDAVVTNCKPATGSLYTA